MLSMINVARSRLVEIASDYNNKITERRHMTIFSDELHTTFMHCSFNGIYTKLFVRISYHIFDDHKTLELKSTNETGSKYRNTYHVRDNNIAQFLYDFVVNKKINTDLLSKNWPKIKSSQYGARLHDISIVCIEN